MSAEIVALIGLLGATMISAGATVAVAVINKSRSSTPPADGTPAAIPGIPVAVEPDLDDEALAQLDYWHRRTQAAEAVLEDRGIPLPYTPLIAPMKESHHEP